MLGVFAAYYMESNGHHVTGMNNQIVWGLPHVFAIFLIVAASGALNVASIGSVFGKTAYK
ncbi:MAG: polysulfide reductase NrfD, partial [Rhodospirillaceae bacterium]|nr:polysulfide reductase NrfD [Rhodospirillaceae bacterium]